MALNLNNVTPPGRIAVIIFQRVDTINIRDLRLEIFLIGGLTPVEK